MTKGKIKPTTQTKSQYIKQKTKKSKFIALHTNIKSKIFFKQIIKKYNHRQIQNHKKKKSNKKE